MPQNQEYLIQKRKALARRGLGREESYVFAHRFVLTANQELVFIHNIGAEAEFIWTAIGYRATDTSVGGGNALESFQVQYLSTSSGRIHQSEPILPITQAGTIGLPFKQPVRTLFEKSSNIQVTVTNLAAGANTVDVSLFGYKWYDQ